jgi:hypothetical protein
MRTLKFRKREGLNHISIYVKGFELDEIAEVAELSRDGLILENWANLAGWTGASGNPPDAFWRTLVGDRERGERSPPPYWVTACEQAFAKGGYAGGTVNTTDLIRYERNPVLLRFCRRVQAVIWNRALVKTRSGKLGLVKRGVRTGNIIYVLHDCSVPIVLRQHDQVPERVQRELE